MLIRQEYAKRALRFALDSVLGRPHLCGVQFETTGEVLRSVSSDGHRMAFLEHAKYTAPAEVAWVPRFLLEHAIRSFSGVECEISQGDETSTVREVPPLVSIKDIGKDKPRQSASAYLPGCKFPKVDTFLAMPFARTVTCSSRAFRAALKGLAVRDSQSVRLTTSEGIAWLSVENPEDVKERWREVRIDGAECDEKAFRFDIGVNAGYLASILREVTHVRLELNGDLDPLVFRGDTDTLVTMPIRL